MQKLKSEQLKRIDVEAYKIQEKLPIVLVLDNLRSMHNIGSIFRTADGFSIEEIFLCGITAKPPHREIEKTALGATDAVKWSHYPNTELALNELHKKEYTILAVEQATGSCYLNDFKPNKDEKYALVFGNEVDGVSEEAMKIVNGCIEIPQFGTKHSFNVVISAGIVLWDLYAKLKLKYG